MFRAKKVIPSVPVKPTKDVTPSTPLTIEPLTKALKEAGFLE